MLTCDLQGLDLPDPEVLFSRAAGHETIALAVSGGADSLALMVLAFLWKNRVPGPPEIFVYSVDHGLRKEAAKEAAMVVALAHKLGFGARALVWREEKPATGMQAAARQARYSLLREAMARDGATLLLTGHHREDQAETVLMRLAHASGLGGLGGMRGQARVENIDIYRPLLNLSKEVLGEIVSRAGLVPVIDPSNAEEKYERVRWRRVLPVLAELGLDGATLARFSQRMARADSALGQMARSSFGELVARDRFGGLSICRGKLNEMPGEIALRVLSKMIDIASGNRGGGELAQLESLVEATAQERFEGQTIAGCVVRQKGGAILVFRELGRIEASAIAVRCGQTIVWDQRFIIHNCSTDEVRVCSGSEFSREKVKVLLGGDIALPIALVRSAPLVRGPGGEVLALGSHSFSPHLRMAHKGDFPAA